MNDLGQDLMEDIQEAAKQFQEDLKSEIRRNYILRIAGPLLVAALFWINRKGR